MWLVDLAVGAGFRTHVFEFPTAVKDFNREYLEPIKNYQETLGEHILLSHSTGGLIAAYLSAQRKSIYMSPWWGMFGYKLRGTTLTDG